MTYLQRKKLAFMSIVNQIKGFVRSVSGALPLTLPDCIAGGLLNYTLSGNSVQNGTPTPENPVEVESVGEKTDNLLFGIERATNSLSTYMIEDNTLIITPTSLKAYQSYVSIKLRELELGKTYTVSFNIEYDASSGARPFIRVGYHGDSNKWSGDYKTRTVTSSGRYSITFTMPETMPDDINSYGFCMLFNYTNVAATELSDCKIYDIMLVEGNESADYEPYGYKIPVVCGQLLDSIKYKKGYFINSSGVETAQNSYKCTEDYIPVLPNTTYRIICVGIVAKDVSLTMPFYDSNKVFISRSVFGTFEEVPKIGEFTTPSNCYYIRFSLPNHGYDVSLYNLDNTTNIYLDEPLRKIGSVADTIDFAKQLITRKIKKWMFTEWDTSQAIDYYSNRMSDSQIWNTCCVTIPFKNMALGYSNKMVSHFKRGTNGQAFTSTAATHGIYSAHTNYNRIYINLGDSKTLYNSNNPISNWEHWNEAYVVGELATPTEEQITLPKLPTFSGTTVCTIDTSIQPSNMSATYYATSKE